MMINVKDVFLIIGIHIFSPRLIKNRLDYYFNRFKKSKEVVRKINGVNMLLSLEDQGISRQLIMYGKREHYMTEHILNSGIIKKGDTVLDIGANIGYYALLESKLVGDSGKVYAIEPVSLNMQNLKRNIALNNCINIETYKLAIGEKNESKLIHISNKSNLSSLLKENGVEYYQEELVKIVSVDEFLNGKNFPKFIRMDVEGFEYYIIKGMKKTLKNHPDLIIEIHGFIMSKNQINSFFNTLNDNQYIVKYCVVDNLHNINKYANVLVEKMSFWKTPKILKLDLNGLHKWILKGKSAHVHFSWSQEGVLF